MNRSKFVGIGLAIVSVGVVVCTTPLFSQQNKKITLKVLTPPVEFKVNVSVDKKDIEGTGTERTFDVTTAKDTVTVTAMWEPNNYTKIFRSRKIEVKEGAPIEVDLRKPSDRQKDHIEVRWVPTPKDVVEEMCKLGKVTKDDIVYDLGCGDGVMVITAVKEFKAKKGVGVDIDKKKVEESKANAKEAGVDDKVTFRVGDVLKIDDLSDANVVLLYMGDDINLRLRPILKKTLKPGSRVVSHRFLMGDWEPHKTLKYTGKDGSDYELHLWIIGKDGKVEKSK